MRVKSPGQAATTVQAAGTGKVGSEPVRTANGLVSGTTGKIDGVIVYKGIPFGAPPVGSCALEAATAGDVVGRRSCRR